MNLDSILNEFSYHSDSSVCKNKRDYKVIKQLTKLKTQQLALKEKDIEEIMNEIKGVKYLENSEEEIDRLRAEVMKKNHKTIAKVISEKMGEKLK